MPGTHLPIHPAPYNRDSTCDRPTTSSHPPEAPVNTMNLSFALAALVLLAAEHTAHARFCPDFCIIDESASTTSVSCPCGAPPTPIPPIPTPGP
ncbi:hypothetical protein PsYK624_091930 [Phanerochaete sordida]|uniref:Uncharacterized protein n=1 Tax=Phanerochaete sordida TaxID=48140 RepID=A0A9P3GG24_9APHY|nr:hypothetical protein PsYK624_091930 [Phanerochaete sordida]